MARVAVSGAGEADVRDPEYVDTRLWMEGLEEQARAFILAMPEEGRRGYDRIVLCSWHGIRAQGHDVPPRAKQLVFLVFRRGTRYCFFPVARPLIGSPDMAPSILRAADRWFAETDPGARGSR
jgi:hypothetical protein